MDIKDHEAGVSTDFFRYRGKKELIEILLQKIPLKKDQKILVVGAGTGDDLETIAKFGQVTLVDINPEALALAPVKLVKEKKVASACGLPYPEKSFDLAVAFDVLEHIKEDRKAVREITRVLKTEGSFVFLVPAFSFLFGSHDKALDHFRRYNRQDIQNLFEDRANLKTGYWTFFLFFPVMIQRLLTRRAKPKIQYFPLPKIIDDLFYGMLKLENALIRRGIDLPLGINLFGIYRKL